MSDIINKWISDRLGIILQDQTKLEEDTKCGRLVAEILNNYDIINDDQLKSIQNTNKPEICQKNYTYITDWLKRLSIKLTSEEIEEITNGKLTTINALLYKLFLHLNNKSCLSYVANEAFNQKCRPEHTRFTVKAVKEANIEKVKHKRRSNAQIIDNSFDILHWRQDRLEALLNKCKAAREEYIGYVMRTRSRVFSSNVALVSRPSMHDVPEEDEKSVASVNLDCKQLLDEKTRAKAMESFVPDAQKAQKIVEGIKRKQQKTAENNIMRSQLQNELLANFDRKIQSAESIESQQDTYEKLLKQSIYEKQMITKVQEIKYQREVMLQDKQLINDAIAKENEKQFIENMLQKDKMLNDKELQYYLEKERVLQLHRTIYNERIRLRKEKSEKLCSKIVDGIVNLAMKEAEHKENFAGDEPDERTKSQWYRHFIIDESLEDYITPVEQIITYEENGSETDALIYKEIERQEKLDRYDFRCYQNFETPWSLITVDLAENDREMMNSGMNVLGYIVFKLLEAKYPQHTFSDPIHFQDLIAAVCVQGFNEHAWLPTLQQLLEHKKIIVVEMQDGLNYCLDMYKRESKRDDDDENVRKEEGVETTDRQSKVKGELIRRSRKSIRTRNESVLGDAGEDGEIKKIDKNVQTPKLFPDEEPVLSKAAELGKIADEELSKGRPLTDFLLIDMFKEYLKSHLNHMRGWVLINYPDTLDQAALLEEALSGRHVPGISPKMKTCRSIIEVRDIEFEPENRRWDENEIYRKSQLVNNPEYEKAQSYYETVLTAFIRVSLPQKDIAINVTTNQGTAEETINNNNNNQVPEATTKDVNLLDRFYSDQGCSYCLYYDVFDYLTLKHLARLILGDYNIQPKSSVELFGDTIKYINAEYEDKSKTIADSTSPKASKRGEKKERPKEKILKPKEDIDEDDNTEAKRDRRKTDLGRKSVIVRVDKFTQIPEIEYEYVENLDEPSSRPGSAGWQYVDLKIPVEVEILLANIWETLEQVYVSDFSQMLFMRRRLMDGVMPYIKVVKEYLQSYLNRPDDMQSYLRQFQQIYNQFDDDIRNDDEFKAELHCRVHEMKDKLLDICDNKMSNSENERRNVICKNWAPMQLTELFNCYVNACQLEVDRFVDTINLVDDYYTSMINKLPNSEHVLSKEKLQRLEMDDPSIIKATNDILINADTTISVAYNPFNQKIDDFYKRTTAMIAKMYHLVLEKLENAIDTHLPNNSTAGPKSRLGSKKDRRSDKDRIEQSNKIVLVTDSREEDEVKINYQRIFEEWQTVNNGEWSRLNIRLKLLRNDILTNLNEAINSLTKSFHTAYDDIKNKYRNQIESIGEACELLFSAIEEEVKIQEEMIFEDGKFYVDPMVILFPDQDHPDQTPTEPTVEEKNADDNNNDYFFNIDQLTKLVSIFVSLAPSGVIALRSFTFLLQDMIVSEEIAMVPIMWSKLDVNQVEKLVWILYGNAEFVTWKDFIICNIMTIPFPSENEILDMRRQFISLDPQRTEIISKDEYLSTKLWFENHHQYDVDKTSTRLLAIKNLLFNMYGINDQQFNYTGFLSDYCKSNNNSLPEALAKLLALALGRKVCWDKEQGEKYVTDMLEKRRIFEEEQRLLAEAETLKHVQDVQEILDDEVLERTIKMSTNGKQQQQPASIIHDGDDKESTGGKCQMAEKKSSLEQSTSVQLKSKLKSSSATEFSTSTNASTTLKMRPSVRMRDDSRMGRPRKLTATNKGGGASTSFNIQTDIGIGNEVGAGGGGRFLRSTTGTKASKISRKGTKEFLAKLQQDIIDGAIEQSEQRAEEELANMELQSISMDVNENPLEYFIGLNTVQEVLASIIPENLTRLTATRHATNINNNNNNGTVANTLSFHDLIESYFNDLRRPDFNKEVLAHELLNDDRFLALVAGTGKFTVRHPAKVLEEVIQEGK